MCWASAALPPLPKTSSFAPAAKRSASWAAASSIWRASSPSTSACAISACRRSRASASAIVHAPRRQALLREGELGDLAAHLGQHLGHAVLPAKLAVEQHVSAPACAGHLAADRAGTARRRIPG